MRTRKKANRLKVLRAERDVTQMDLAIEAGLSASRYWQIENGYTRATSKELARLARALRVAVEDLGLNTPAPSSTQSSGQAS